MNQSKAASWAGLLMLMAAGAFPSRAVELKVSREALQRTLKGQLFNGALPWFDFGIEAYRNG